MSEPGRIRVAGLTKRYGPTTVLDDLSLTIAPGEIVALLGRSGAGKTTLFRCMVRLAAVDSGGIFVSGKPMHTLQGRALALARSEIGLIFQQFNLVRRSSARDNVLIGQLARLPTWRVLLRRFATADSGRWRRWTVWGCSGTPTSAPTACPAGSSSGWQSRGCWRRSAG